MSSLSHAVHLLTRSDSPHPGPGRILLIDDDDDVRITIARLLTTAGFDVVSASDTTTGLAILRHDGTVRLVLLDLMMPTMDGWSFRADQLASPSVARIPTIVLTGAPLRTVSHAQLQAADYLIKPVGREHLLSVVSNYCEPARLG